MSVRLRLQRHGSKKRPFYRIVAADQRAPRDGRSKEVLGTFDPMHEPNVVDLRVDRVDYWLGVGAQPTETVSALIRKVREGGHFITSAEFEERNRTARRDRQAAALAAKEVVTAKAEAPAAPAAEEAPAEEAPAAEAPAEEPAAEEAAAEEAPAEEAAAEEAPAEEAAAEEAPAEEAAG